MITHPRSLENVRRSAGKTLRLLLDFVKRHSNIILLILSIVLIALAVYLVTQLITYAYKDFFTCKHLIDETLHATTLCESGKIPIGPFNINYLFTDIYWFSIGPWNIPLLPPLKPINTPLEAIRKFVAWNIILAFAVVSLVLAFIVIKINGFVKLLITPEGRKATLTNISLWLLFFAIFSSLFYFGVVVPSLGK